MAFSATGRPFSGASRDDFEEFLDGKQSASVHAPGQLTPIMSTSTRNRAISMGSGKSAGSRAAHHLQQQSTQDYGSSAPMPSMASNYRYFDPCAATGSMFLYAQGSTVVCSHHDTLSIERVFASHNDEVQLLAVDNQSELGSGRHVVSYDAGSTTIVWDLMTGDEVARFASYDHLTAAAWMRNGNVAFGMCFS